MRPLREAPQPSNDATAAPTAETLDSLWPGLEPPRPAADESATRTSSHEPSRPAGEPREPPVEAPVHAPGDFSDLIALAGPAPLDEGYHDYPSALHATVGNRAGRPRGPSVLTLDHDSDPLLNLAAEYEQALLNETAGARHKLNAGAIERPPSARPPADPFEDAERAPSSQSLLDLLVVGQNVDTILDSLDSFGAERIFEDDRRQEILWLLAPQGSTVPRASRAAQLAREEHHLISVDSRIDVIATPSDEPGSHDENDH
ncbi:MAG TPA: TagK domain-containing protein [Paraburkholderia sp.]|nr:TagK domain-containing protein [Paraburkholderia sp.]